MDCRKIVDPFAARNTRMGYVDGAQSIRIPCWLNTYVETMSVKGVFKVIFVSQIQK